MILLSLGSNLGDRRGSIERALSLLEEQGITVVDSSSYYLSEPVDVVDQPEFLNLCCRVETGLQPKALLKVCQSVENDLGRMRTHRRGPRTIDLDLLYYGDCILDDAELTLPHPRLHRRAFVLAPLAEIAPRFRDPRTGRTIAQLLDDCSDAGSVKRLKAPPPD